MHGSPSILPLRLESLSFSAGGERLVDGITARLEAGPRTVILGHNGAGKSLLLRLCHGLLTPSAGRVVWSDHGLGPDWARRRQAMVFQHPVVLRRSARANVTYGLALAGVSWRERRRQADEALAEVGLAELADRPARALSGGERQRLALARAWALHPEVLLLDEPTASLDPAATRAVEAVIAAFDMAGAKIVMTTHDLGQAKRLADEVLFLHKGRLLEHAPAREFFERPCTPEGRAYVAGELVW
ncbi:MAG TPA: ATP-binding cassette domain-containing protein [Stellaceae bacterium]|nr:ATP-binding cassette domain-containing protein [Stellaceae bacterium]